MIDAVVQDLTSAVNEEAKKIHPKEMPKPKRDPPELPKDVEAGKKEDETTTGMCHRQVASSAVQNRAANRRYKGEV